MTPRVVHAWERLPKETDPAFRAFRVYLEMGRADRTLLKTSIAIGHKTREADDRNVGKPSARVETWSRKHGWIKRVRAYDEWLDASGDEARLAADEEDAKLWAERRREIRDVAYAKAKDLLDVSAKLLEKATVMLNTPLHKVVKRESNEDGGKTEIHLHPTDAWKPSDAATLARAGISAVEAADKLRRLAADMVTERFGVDFEFDLNDLPDEMLDDIVDGRLDPTTEKGRQAILHVVEGGRR